MVTLCGQAELWLSPVQGATIPYYGDLLGNFRWDYGEIPVDIMAERADKQETHNENNTSAFQPHKHSPTNVRSGFRQ